MKSEIDENDTLPAGERFIDAALSEHARLGGSGFDTELVHRILRETVNRPTGTITRHRTAADWQLWITGGIAVAALITAALLVLSSLQLGRRDRPSDELHFIVRHLNQPAAAEGGTMTKPPMLAAAPYAAPLNLVSPTSPGSPLRALPSFVHGSFELVTTMGPAFEVMPAAGSRQENFRITADRSHSSADRRIYEGNVVVEHQLFRIEAGEVTVPAPGEAPSESTVPLSASNVKVTQESPYRVAVAKSLRFDPVSGSLILNGVELFETGGGRLRRFSDGDQLVLTGDGFSVENPRVMKYASPPLLVP